MTSPETPFTIASLVDEVIDVLHSYTRVQEQRTSLAAGITSTDTTATVADASALSKGLVEIEDEMVAVKVVDLNTNTVTIEPWGRGQSGSIAAAHLLGARVTQSPLYPRVRVGTAIAGVLREIFPDVFAVGLTALDVNPAVTHYALPADCYHVMGVEWHLPGPTGMWQPAGRWRQNKTDTAVELELLSAVFPGVGRARVRYMRTPPATVLMTDTLSTYGYDISIRDLVVKGAVANLMAFTETSRLQTASVEAHGRSEVVPAGSAQSLSRYLYGLFQKRVEDERKQLLTRYPLQPHRTR